MNYTVKSNSPAGRIPEVGEPWMHQGSNQVFVRISNREGRRAIHGNDEYNDEHLFYSVSLKNGSIYNTNKNKKDIIILQPETPIVFVPKVN